MFPNADENPPPPRLMVLIDTSVWVAHFRAGSSALATLLQERLVLSHPVVIGELATGNLKNRRQTLADLRRLPLAGIASFDECLQFLELHRLFGRGIGWSDTQLLASARLSKATLWTLDKRLAAAAREFSLHHTP